MGISRRNHNQSQVIQKVEETTAEFVFKREVLPGFFDPNGFGFGVLDVEREN
jgi:hypothetical protein